MSPRSVPASSLMLERGYAECARLTRQYGTTYYWGALLLPRAQRRHVYAVYALCRLADDIVDAEGATTDRVAETAERLASFQATFFAALERPSDDPRLAAIAASVAETGIENECFERFFSAMTSDLTVSSYADWEALCGYMEGSAAVIGEMMLPVLQPLTPQARQPARALGLAFQVTNFLRDIGEDLDRGRVYLPADELLRFGADPFRRRVDEPWRQFMASQIVRNRALYDQAREGVEMLPPASARCVNTALVLYSQILERIEARDYDVFSGRARVPTLRKAATAAGSLLRPVRPSSGPRLAPAAS